MYKEFIFSEKIKENIRNQLQYLQGSLKSSNSTIALQDVVNALKSLSMNEIYPHLEFDVRIGMFIILSLFNITYF